MLIDELTRVLDRSGAVASFWQRLDDGQDGVLGVANSARPFLVASRFSHKPQPTLCVVAGEDNAVAFARSIAAYLGEDSVLRFPLREDLPFGSKPSDPRVIARRAEAAWALRSGRACVVVASAQSLLRYIAHPSSRGIKPLSLVAETEIDGMEFPDFVAALVERGYENTGELDGPGTFCVHGGTIDVFPGNSIFPVRLDFFGDELEEIRRIVPSTGQTISTLGSIEIYPVVEPDDVMSQLGDYAGKNTLTTLIEPRSLFDDATHVLDDVKARAKGTGCIVGNYFTDPSALSFGAGQRATYVSIMRVGSDVDDELPVKRVEVAGAGDKLFGRLRSLIDADFTVVFSAPNYRARRDMMYQFVDYGLPINDVTEMSDTQMQSHEHGQTKLQDRAAVNRIGAGKNMTDYTHHVSPNKLKRGVVHVTDADIPLGMIIPKAKLALVSISDTQTSARSRKVRQVDITEVTFPYKPGDYVVHAAHGVAFFRELVRREIDGTFRDYLLLEYADNDKLFVPVEQLDRVTRYVGPEGASPRLTRLNTADWSRALSKARKATKKLAFDLVDVYSRRANSKGYRFSEDTPWQLEMEGAFPYQETADQLAAIAEVKADMQSSKPMDRLICGDVGFGKTEVALRAAFKATQDGKQVMVLCPTTILAQQHFTNFSERCEPFGVSVEVLSRFRTAAQQAEILKRFESGDVQILVGTHRLLSRDVNPRDLGLVIIDEEQRFGVGHKEMFKNMRESIDVLAMSATPIPRTMQMSLSGVRDMSLIMTPPDERRAVKVHVGEWDPDIVSGAIRRELERSGQVYYVSNRVRSIDEAVRRVEEAAGEARIGVAHGKLSKEALERVMEEFSAGNYDVLVATTIIESGIDNPHTNTLIIEDSQRLGLAQMYQLKGRVGRSSTQAYAYFMFPENMSLTEEAQARLTAIDEHQDLGSGMRIAMRDLEIRGAGSILGAEQSGNMSAVGFDLFAQMLASAVNATREGNTSDCDGLPPALSDITVNIPGHTYFPDEYIPEADERVLWYRKIAAAATAEAVDAIAVDLKEKRPEMPQAAINLLNKARIKAFANEHGIKTVSVAGGKLIVEPVNIPDTMTTELRRNAARYLKDKKKLALPMKYFKLAKDDDMLVAIAAFLEKLSTAE